MEESQRLKKNVAKKSVNRAFLFYAGLWRAILTKVTESCYNGNNGGGSAFDVAAYYAGGRRK